MTKHVMHDDQVYRREYCFTCPHCNWYLKYDDLYDYPEVIEMIGSSSCFIVTCYKCGGKFRINVSKFECVYEKTCDNCDERLTCLSYPDVIEVPVTYYEDRVPDLP